MQVQQEKIALRAAIPPRFVLLLGVVIPLALFVLLHAVQPTPAAAAEPTFEDTADLQFEEEFGEEAEEPEEECEEFEELLEECEEAEEGEEARDSGSPPEECLLRSAQARVVAYASRNRIRLTVGYTTYEPAPATVDYLAKGSRGALRLRSPKRRLGRSGVIRLTKLLADPQMGKLQAAGRLDVRLHISGAPGNCRRFETQHLAVRHTSDSQTVWSEKR